MTSTASITILRDTATAPAGLVWENPPDRDRQSGKYASIAAALHEHPGQWAVIRAYPTDQGKRAWSFAGVIRQGRLNDFPNGGFEACARTVGDEVRVYVRAVAR